MLLSGSPIPCGTAPLQRASHQHCLRLALPCCLSYLSSKEIYWWHAVNDRSSDGDRTATNCQTGESTGGLLLMMKALMVLVATETFQTNK